MMAGVRVGDHNLITDVAGLRVGNATSSRVRSGVTVIVTDRGMRAGCDVGGGAPGTRETDSLRPGNLVGRAHAIVLSGGSVFGLGAADAVTTKLSAEQCGLRLRRNTPVVPIVPAAVIYDLANDGDKNWGRRPPYANLGLKALAAAKRKFRLGSVGAGRGATAGDWPGGLGSASVVLEVVGGITVGGLVIANPAGSPYMADGKTPWAWPLEIKGEFGGRRPDPATLETSIDPMPGGSLVSRQRRSLNTMVAVVATDADLSTAECERVSCAAQDGFARAVRPSHTLMDGDTIFTLASGQKAIKGGREFVLAALGSAAADCIARAVARGVYAARNS